MDRPPLLGVHGPAGVVHRLTKHVEHAAERLGPDGHRDRTTLILGRHAALQAVGRLHRHGADSVFAEVLLDLADDVHIGGPGLAGHPHGVIDVRQVTALEHDVEDRTDDLDNPADLHCFSN